MGVMGPEAEISSFDINFGDGHRNLQQVKLNHEDHKHHEDHEDLKGYKENIFLGVLEVFAVQLLSCRISGL